jgi:hypothetical protein
MTLGAWEGRPSIHFNYPITQLSNLSRFRPRVLAEDLGERPRLRRLAGWALLELDKNHRSIGPDPGSGSARCRTAATPGRQVGVCRTHRAPVDLYALRISTCCPSRSTPGDEHDVSTATAYHEERMPRRSRALLVWISCTSWPSGLRDDQSSPGDIDNVPS